MHAARLAGHSQKNTQASEDSHVAHELSLDTYLFRYVCLHFVEQREGLGGGPSHVQNIDED